MKSYPYIGKFQQSIKLFYDVNKFIEIACGHGSNRHESNYTNITHEYLANTYGEVVSPEHAEFIIELAESHGFELIANGTSNKNFFHIGERSFAMLINEPTFKGDCKEITIPLPPKTEPLKNAGDNLVLGCEQDFKVAREIINELREEANCSDELLAGRDEWPKIGDEVLVYSSARRLAEIKGKVVKVIGKCTHSDGSTIITVEHSSLGVFAVADGSWIKKPKTPEEELRDGIVNLINYAGSFSEKVVADALMSKYNITKKPQ